MEQSKQAALLDTAWDIDGVIAVSDRFYAPDLDRSCNPYEIDGPEAHHMLHVCRVREGMQVELFDGRGTRATATVLAIQKRRAVLEVDHFQTSEPPGELVVATAMPKGDRATVLVEKCTELGVQTLIPLATSRSVTHPGEGKQRKFDRIVIEACKQCGRDFLMRIEPVSSLTEVLSRSGNRLFFDVSGEVRDCRSARTSAGATTLAIGPEGGWNPGEVEQARSAGWSIIRLPGYILRVETAVLAAVSMVRFSSP